MSDRLSIRLGPLRPLLERSAAEHGLCLSDEVRRRLAASLGVLAPYLRPGNPDIAAESAKGVAARVAAERVAPDGGGSVS